MDIGSAVGRATGVTEEQLLELSRYDESPAFSELERAVIEYATHMTETPAHIPTQLGARLQQELDPAQLVELSMAIAWENYRARFNHALGIPSDGFSEGAVCALAVAPSTSALGEAPSAE
jgi:alkylhydroperoxidase family enzyme